MRAVGVTVYFYIHDTVKSFHCLGLHSTRLKIPEFRVMPGATKPFVLFNNPWYSINRGAGGLVGLGWYMCIGT